MNNISISDLVKIINGYLVNKGISDYITKVSIFPLKIFPADVFFALDGTKYSNTDGGLGFTGNEDSILGYGGTHQNKKNIETAIKNGAKTIIFDDDTILIKKDINYIKVNDVLSALTLYSKYLLNLYKTKVICVTGSTGKTTTVNAIINFLSTKYSISKPNYIRTTLLSLNWHIINNLSPDVDYLVIEMQSDGQGQIDRFCDVSPPDYAFLLNINHTHIQRFGTLENTLNEKLAIYRKLKSQGKLFINIDNNILYDWFSKQNDERIRTISTNNTNANYICKNILENDGVYQFDIINNLSNKVLCGIKSSLPGKHNILPIIYLYSLCQELGISDIDFNKYIKTIKPIIGRFQLFKGKNDSTILIDSYNASFDSTINGIDYLTKLNVRRRILVIGSLLELASDCENIHRKLGLYIDNTANIDYLICFGDETLYIIDQIQSKNIQIFHSFSYDEVIQFIESIGFDSSTAVYIKGSGAMRMEIIGLHCLANMEYQ